MQRHNRLFGQSFIFRSFHEELIGDETLYDMTTIGDSDEA
jgi:hypothetical protein